MATLRPYNLSDLELEGERIRSGARERAKEILRGAVLQSERLREQSRQEGATAGRNEGLKLGLEEGRRQGLKEEKARIAAETASLAETVKAIARETAAKQRDLLGAAERDLVGLALAIARKVVKVESARNPEVLRENVRRAIALTAQKAELEVVVHPSQREAIEAYLPDLRRDLLEVRGLSVVPDAAVAPGGCVVRTRRGAVSAELDVQLAAIEQALLGDAAGPNDQ